jgi:phosphopantothenoylcysteine synthetase/decarboxylase
MTHQHDAADARNQAGKPGEFSSAPQSQSNSNSDSPCPQLANRNILIALTGGIACYKVATVTSKLVQAGANVRVIMTKAATKFIGPATFQALTGQPVLTSVFDSPDHLDSPHVGLARWCDLMLTAPATADHIAKLATGLCDDIVALTATALPTDTPRLVAPAMNADMWTNPIVQRNVATITKLLNVQLIGPESGWQACRTDGTGRMSEAETIVHSVEDRLTKTG